MTPAPVCERPAVAREERLKLATLLYAVAHELWRRDPCARRERLRLRALAAVAEARCHG